MGRKDITRGFLIHKNDSVLTLLDPGKPGDKIKIVGEKKNLRIQLKEDITSGHKVACKDIKKGDQIIKYGYPIGFATCNISAGEWVHTHNIASNYDESVRKK
jgi:altronate hydrolase